MQEQTLRNTEEFTKNPPEYVSLNSRWMHFLMPGDTVYFRYGDDRRSDISITRATLLDREQVESAHDPHTGRITSSNAVGQYPIRFTTVYKGTNTTHQPGEVIQAHLCDLYLDKRETFTAERLDVLFTEKNGVQSKSN